MAFLFQHFTNTTCIVSESTSFGRKGTHLRSEEILFVIYLLHKLIVFYIQTTLIRYSPYQIHKSSKFIIIPLINEYYHFQVLLQVIFCILIVQFYYLKSAINDHRKYCRTMMLSKAVKKLEAILLLLKRNRSRN